MKTHPILALAALAALPQVARADAASTGPMIYGVAGTGGVGGGLGYHVNELLTFRGEIASYNSSHSFDQDGVNYSGTLKLATKGVYVDLHPFGGSFRVTAGLNAGRPSLEGSATGSVDVNGTTYSMGPGEAISAAVKYPSTMPYLGIGWGLNGRGVNVGLDLGVDIGKPSLTMTNNFAGAPAGFAADFEAQKARYADDVAKIKFFPVIKLSVGISF